MAVEVALPVLRLISGATLGLSVCAALLFSEKAIRESQARVSQAREHGSAAVMETARIEAEREQQRLDPQLYMAAAATDASAFGIEAPSYEELLAPNRHMIHLEDAIVLAPRKSYENANLRITAVVEKVRYQRHGAMVAAQHAIARVENISKHPIAYYLRLRSDTRGNCEIRGARMHNAMSLMPGERAEITVCAGGGAIRVEHVEVMEVTELGHRYLSQLPPSAAGHDANSDAAHRPLQQVTSCATQDHRRLGSLVRDGGTRWRDVVDFFSRHSCERYSFPADYRLAEAALTRLPAVAAEAPP